MNQSSQVSHPRHKSHVTAATRRRVAPAEESGTTLLPLPTAHHRPRARSPGSPLRGTSDLGPSLGMGPASGPTWTRGSRLKAPRGLRSAPGPPAACKAGAKCGGAGDLGHPGRGQTAPPGRPAAGSGPARPVPAPQRPSLGGAPVPATRPRPGRCSSEAGRAQRQPRGRPCSLLVRARGAALARALTLGFREPGLPRANSSYRQ